MPRKMSPFTLVALSCLVVLFASSEAIADSFVLNNPNQDLTNAGFPAGTSFGTVNASLVGNVMTVNVTMNGVFSIKILDGNDFGLNVQGSNLNVSNMVGSANADGSSPFNITATIKTNQNISEFGNFTTVLFHMQNAAPQGNNVNLKYLSFTVTGVTSLQGASFVAHVVAPNATGFVGSSSVPEPASALLMGAGLLTAAVLRRRRYSKMQDTA